MQRSTSSTLRCALISLKKRVHTSPNLSVGFASNVSALVDRELADEFASRGVLRSVETSHDDERLLPLGADAYTEAAHDAVIDDVVALALRWERFDVCVSQLLAYHVCPPGLSWATKSALPTLMIRHQTLILNG